MQNTAETNVDLAPLNALRAEQDGVDREIIVALAKRLVLRKKISAFRIENNLPTIDPARREAVMKQAEQIAAENGVPAEMIHEIFDVLIDWSHRLDRQWRKE
jgi:chorismate mutase